MVLLIYGAPFAHINLPTGLILLLWGALTVTLRRESIAQLMGLLRMENGMFYASSVRDGSTCASAASVGIRPLGSWGVDAAAQRAHRPFGSYDREAPRASGHQ